MSLQQEDTKLDTTEHAEDRNHVEESHNNSVKTPHIVNAPKRPRGLFAQMKTKQAEKKRKMDNRLQTDNSRSTETEDSENHREADSGVEQRPPSIGIMERLHDRRHTVIKRRLPKSSETRKPERFSQRIRITTAEKDGQCRRQYQQCHTHNITG
jgi:hypothetical protein